MGIKDQKAIRIAKQKARQTKVAARQHDLQKNKAANERRLQGRQPVSAVPQDDRTE